MKLKYTEVKTYREQQLQAQNHNCALCGERIDGDAVLDHCHKTGLLRKVLHRGCNALLGKIENNMARNGVDYMRLEIFASNLAAYISTEWTTVLHPTYKTPEERRELSKKRAKARRKKRASA